MAASSSGIVVVGVAPLDASLTALAAEVEHLEIPGREAGEAALAKATPRVPVKSGALRSSGRVVTEVGAVDVIWDRVYAGVIFGGWPAHNISPQPWVDEPEITEAVAGVFEDYLEAAVHRVRGA